MWSSMTFGPCSKETARIPSSVCRPSGSRLHGALRRFGPSRRPRRQTYERRAFDLIDLTRSSKARRKVVARVTIPGVAVHGRRIRRACAARGTAVDRTGAGAAETNTAATGAEEAVERRAVRGHRGLSMTRVWPGSPHPLGATWDGEGVNFALFSHHAEAVELCLFDGTTTPRRARACSSSNAPPTCGTRICPTYVPGSSTAIASTAPTRRTQGHRFNPEKLLLDPYARAVSGRVHWDDALFGYKVGSAEQDVSFSPKDSAGKLRSASSSSPPSRGATIDRRASRGAETVIYECHVKGMTARHPDVPAHLRGTYLGLASDPSSITCRASASPRSSCCRFTTTSSTASRRARAHQLLGLQHARVLRARCPLCDRRTQARRSPSSRRW